MHATVDQKVTGSIVTAGEHPTVVIEPGTKMSVVSTQQDGETIGNLGGTKVRVPKEERPKLKFGQ